MSREKQIEEVRKDIFAAFGGYAKWEEDWQSLAEAVYNAGYRRQEWISVEERLPEREGYYLTSTIKGVIMIGAFFSYYASTYNPQFKYDVTHWMPLPEPPKKGGE